MGQVHRQFKAGAGRQHWRRGSACEPLGKEAPPSSCLICPIAVFLGILFSAFSLSQRMEGRGKENARRLRASPKPRIGPSRATVEGLARAWEKAGNGRGSRLAHAHTVNCGRGVGGEARALVCGARPLRQGSGAYRNSSSSSAPEKTDLKPSLSILTPLLKHTSSTRAALVLRDIITLFTALRETAQLFREGPASQRRPPLPALRTTRPSRSPSASGPGLPWLPSGCFNN